MVSFGESSSGARFSNFLQTISSTVCMWAIFQSGNSPIVMHLLKKLDNHSNTMQLAIFTNLDGMSLGELLDFI